MDPLISKLVDNIGTVVVGKNDIVKLAVASLLARGHVLVEDAPGLGKTLLARALAASIAAEFKRIQFTPDLLPADVTGVSVWNPRDNGFEFVRGPVFTQVLLADEINRTSPRTQSALLEAMEERQVTIDGISYPLHEVFFVMATQNPVELSGTYPLPEAQLDRFLMRLELGYPEPEEEMRILALHGADDPSKRLSPCVTIEQIVALQKRVRAIVATPAIHEYIVAIANETRRHPEVRLGLSPRGSLALLRAAQAWSLIEGANHVTPDAVKAVAPYVLSHRLIVDAHRELTMRGHAALVAEILDQVAVPTMPHAASPRVP